MLLEERLPVTIHPTPVVVIFPDSVKVDDAALFLIVIGCELLDVVVMAPDHVLFPATLSKIEEERPPVSMVNGLFETVKPPESDSVAPSMTEKLDDDVIAVLDAAIRRPAFMAVEPEYELLPERVSVPVPILVKEPVPDKFPENVFVPLLEPTTMLLPPIFRGPLPDKPPKVYVLDPLTPNDTVPEFSVNVEF
jgi:hypothetical protein